MAGSPGTPGFDEIPRRPVAATVVLFALVVTGAAVFAHVFRATTLDGLRWIADESSAVEAARHLHPVALFLLVFATVAVAGVIGMAVDNRARHRVGVEAVAASARGEERIISFRASMVRAGATWLLSVGAASVGRESAIIETGGAAGAVTARHTGGRGAAMATAGIAAAFAAAYHAPLAAILYVEEHLGVRHSRRGIVFALAGAVGGHLATKWLFDVEPIFPDLDGGRWALVPTSSLVIVPALLAARLFRQMRVRLSGRALADRFHVHRLVIVLACSAVAGLAIALFPLAAGNGMEALRSSHAEATVTVALALTLGKLVGTTATLASGAPGGVVTPTMAITAGVGLLVVLGLNEMGFGLDHPWDLMVACMAVGVAVGMRSPMVAAVLVPEMLGDYVLILPMVVIVAAALALDRLVDVALRRTALMVPTKVYDEDG